MSDGTPSKPRSRGRPALPKGEARNETIPIRVTARERASYERAAKKAGLTLSEWMRQCLNAGAIGGKS